MKVEDELKQLAHDRESATQATLEGMPFEPDRLRRQIREYLSRQVERDRMKRLNDGVPQLTKIQSDLYELTCQEAEFSDGGQLLFQIQLQESRLGWLVKRFKFHLQLPSSRNINMVRIELNSEASYDPLKVPRCHVHIGDSGAHIPFPIMNPRLILCLICEHIEPDFSISTD